MPVFFDQTIGEEVELPDGMDPVRQQMAMQSLYQQKQQQNQGAVLGFLGQTLAQAAQPRRQTYATVSPAAAYAMTPQGYEAHMARNQGVLNQQAQQDWASQEKAAERQQQNAIQMKQAEMEQKRMMQQEKYYGNSLKLQEQRYNNEQKRQAFQDRLEEDRRKREEAKAQQEMEQGKVVGGQNIVWNPETKTWVARQIEGYVDPRESSSGGSGGSGHGRRRSGGGDGDRVSVSSLVGWTPTKLPDGSTGYINPETKQVMTQEQYAYQEQIDNAWEEKYSPKLGHVLYNTITQETRTVGGGSDAAGTGAGGSGGSRSGKGPQTADEWVRENFKPVPGGTEVDNAQELQVLRSTAAMLFPESQASKIPPMPQTYPVPKGFPNPEPKNTAAPRRATVNGVLGYVQNDGTFVPDDPNAY